MGFSVPASAGGWPKGTKFAHPECAKKPEKGSVMCFVPLKAIPFSEMLKGKRVSFEWFKKINKLGSNITQESLASPNTAYAIGVF